MAIAANSIAPESSEKLYTEADLVVLPVELPSGPVRYELDNGRLVSMVPPGDSHGRIQGRFVAQFINQGETQGHGDAWSEVGIVLWRDPDRIVGADAAFVAKSSLPVRCSSEGYLETIPEIVVEVRSKNDSSAYVEQKITDYLKAGVRFVLIADPKTRSVAVHSLTQTAQIYGPDDNLTLEPVIPGFSFRVADFFPA